MNVSKVKSLINDHKDEILAYRTRNEKLDYVNWSLERTYYPESFNDALTAPITDFIAAANCIEIQPVGISYVKIKNYGKRNIGFYQQRWGRC